MAKHEIEISTTLGKISIQDTYKNSQANVLITVSNQSGSFSRLVTNGQIHEVKPKDYVQTPKERVPTKTQARNRKISNAFRILSVVFSIILITFSALSFLGFVKARIVLTNSMQPAISAGDIVLLASPDRMKPEVGSIVAYTAKRFDGSSVGVFTHRIIGIEENGGYLVKGDSNPAPDTQRPLPEDVNGVVFFVVPFLGKLLSVKTLVFLIPALLGLWMILDALRTDN